MAQRGSRIIAKLKKPSGERVGHVQALTRALSVLSTLAEHDEGMTLTEISRATQLAPSTTHRLLTTLQQERYIRFDSETSHWLIGVQAFVVGSSFVRSRDIVRVARPFLRRLVDVSGETANFVIEDEGMAVYIGQAESRQTVRAIARPGGRVFMHNSALGKTILASLPQDQVVKIIERHGLPSFTSQTIKDPNELMQHLEKVRLQGFGVDDEEYAVGLRCVAAAVFDEEGTPLGAMSVSGPTVRLSSERVLVLGAAVRSVADEVTAELGGRRPR
jgi:IclR family transcriptional regulator, acetate operon repressor